MARHVRNFVEMFLAQFYALVRRMSEASKCDGALEGVSDLPAIPHGPEFLLGGLNLEKTFSMRNEGIIFILNGDIARCSRFDMIRPYPPCTSPVEWWIIQRYMNSGLERFVERAHSVGGEKQNPFVVF